MKPLAYLLPLVVCLAAATATPASAASWKSIGAGPDSVLVDVDQGLDGSRHAVFLERRAGAGVSGYDVVDRELGSNGSLAGTQPVAEGWSSVSAARLIPTVQGQVALVSGSPTAGDRTVVRAFRAPLGGGAWSPIAADDAHRLAGDTFFADVAQLFTGVSAAKIVDGPPLAALPDGTILVTTPRYSDQTTVRRALTGQSPSPEGAIEPPDSRGDNCQIGRSAPVTDAAGGAYVVYSIGSSTGAGGGCKDALLRQQIDPATLAPIGAPVELAVPGSLGGADSLEVNPGAFLSNNFFQAFTGPGGGPWALHTLHVDTRKSRRVELALWDDRGKLVRVPRYRRRGQPAPDPVLPGSRAQPAVRTFPNGDLVIVYETASQHLYQRACPSRRRRCIYGLLPPAIVVARYHARKWTVKELPGPRYRKRGEFFVALRVLGDSSEAVDVAVESDYTPRGGIPTDPAQLFAAKGSVFVQRVKF